MESSPQPLLRTRRGLLFSTIPAIAVLAVLGLLLALQHHKSGVRERHKEMRAIAEAAATNARRFIDDQFNTLSAVAAAPPVRDGRWAQTRSYLGVVARRANFTGGLGVTDAEGVLRVSTQGIPAQGIALGDREYVRSAIATGEPTVSDALVSRTRRRPVLAFCYPITARDGTAAGAVVSSLRLDQVGDTLNRLLYATAPGETIIDGQGNVLVGPDPIRTVQQAPSHFPLQRMRERRSGVISALDTPSGKRLVGYETVPGTSWLAIVDEDHGAVIGPLDTLLYAELLTLAVLATLGVLATLSGARRLERVAAEREAALAEQRDIALELQRSLLPELPRRVKLDVHASYAPAQGALAVGGDWYDVVETGDGRVALSVGDVAGHGLAAAAAMGQLRSAVRTLALAQAEPAEALAQLDRFASTLQGRPLATVVFALLDPESGHLRYAVAGHPPPFVVRADGSTQLLNHGRSTLLGVASGETRPEGELRVRPGDTLVFYTDGLVEDPESSIDDGIARLRSLAADGAARDPGALAAELVAGVGEPRRDDTAVLCVRLKAVPADGRARPQPSSVAS